MITPKNMIALWDTDDQWHVTKLVIVNRDEQNSRTDKLPASAGSCDSGWMGGNVLETPLGLYAHLSTTHGFSDRKVAYEALREFAKVEGQDWASELLERAGQRRAA
jgi:hypothetical protein